MPTASRDLRDKMLAYFNQGIDCHAPLQYLKNGWWSEKTGYLFSPNRPITEKEWDCVDFLCDEWDFAYDAAKPAVAN